MSISTQQVFVLVKVADDSVATDDSSIPLIYLNEESANIAAVERFGENSIKKGKIRVTPTLARGYTNEEAAEVKEVNFRAKRSRDSENESESEDPKKKRKQLGSSKKR